MSERTTETLDRLYLEWSQFTSARTGRELELSAALDQLVNVPRWLQRNALAGHLLRYPDDCMGCPCFEARS